MPGKLAVQGLPGAKRRDAAVGRALDSELSRRQDRPAREDGQPLLQARRDELTHHAEYARMQAQYGRAWAALAYLLPESEMP